MRQDTVYPNLSFRLRYLDTYYIPYRFSEYSSNSHSINIFHNQHIKINNYANYPYCAIFATRCRDCVHLRRVVQQKSWKIQTETNNDSDLQTIIPKERYHLMILPAEGKQNTAICFWYLPLMRMQKKVQPLQDQKQNETRCFFQFRHMDM